MKIECETGRIKVQSASYGEPDRNCHAETSQEVVSRLCDDLRQCEIGATNRVFGDPCSGVYKSLIVSYSCGYSKWKLLTKNQGTFLRHKLWLQ